MQLSAAAILREDEPPVPDDVKAIFYATAILGVRSPLFDSETSTKY